jgi:hypothetical protein
MNLNLLRPQNLWSKFRSRPLQYVVYKVQFLLFSQLRPYLLENTGSRPISKVKLGRAALVLQWETMWESVGAVVFFDHKCHFSSSKFELVKSTPL